MHLQDFITPGCHSDPDLVHDGVTLHMRYDLHQASCQVSWLFVDILNAVVVSLDSSFRTGALITHRQEFCYWQLTTEFLLIIALRQMKLPCPKVISL